jgi:hypothetical protein
MMMMIVIIIIIIIIIISLDSSFELALSYLLDDWRSILGSGKRYFSSLWFPREPSRGSKRPGYEAGHFPISNVQVKNDGAIISLLPVPSWHGD